MNAEVVLGHTWSELAQGIKEHGTEEGGCRRVCRCINWCTHPTASSKGYLSPVERCANTSCWDLPHPDTPGMAASLACPGPEPETSPRNTFSVSRWACCLLRAHTSCGWPSFGENAIFQCSWFDHLFWWERVGGGWLLVKSPDTASGGLSPGPASAVITHFCTWFYKNHSYREEAQVGPKFPRILFSLFFLREIFLSFKKKIIIW